MNAFPPKIDLKEKNIIITGGYGHLGSAIVKSLLLHNSSVAILARDHTKYQKFISKLDPEYHPMLHFETCDISVSTSIKKAFSNAENKFGQINALINNGFYIKGQSPEKMSDEDWHSGIDGVLSSVFRCIREIIPMMKKSGGSIINISSIYGMVAPDFNLYNESPEILNPPHYGAAKAGILQLTRYYASYLGKYNIRVNTVTPGAFPSGKVQEDSAFIKKLENKTVLNRIGKPEDVAGICVFLASEAASYITGQNFIVDGGWTCR